LLKKQQELDRIQGGEEVVERRVLKPGIDEAPFSFPFIRELAPGAVGQGLYLPRDIRQYVVRKEVVQNDMRKRFCPGV
jgi:hypothetical protein